MADSSERRRIEDQIGYALWGIILVSVFAWGVYVRFTSPPSATPNSPTDSDLYFVGRQRLESSLRDPTSLQILEERLIRPGKRGGEVGYYARYRAKNGFGGFVQDEFYTE